MTKKQIFDLLKSSEVEKSLYQMKNVPIHKLLKPLFSALCNEDEEVKWHAVTVTGVLVADLAQRDLEGARNILRRMMWLLNGDSGGIGWGIPEALGDILARNEILAREFAPILVSYLRPEGNFLEFELLQRGTLWGIGRLAEARPLLLQALHTADYLARFFASADPSVRGHALRAAGRIGIPEALGKIEDLLHDESEIKVYEGQKLRTLRISDLAREILESLRYGGYHPPDGRPST